MGEKFYYITQVLIFSGIAIFAIRKPKLLVKNIFKNDNTKVVVGRVFGVFAIINVIINLKKLL